MEENINNELLQLIDSKKGSSKKQSFIFKMKDLLVKDLACRLPYNNTWLRIYNYTGTDNQWTRVKLDADVWKKIKESKFGLVHVRAELKPVAALDYREVDEIFNEVLGSQEEADKYGDWIKFKCDGDIEFIFNRRSYKDVQKLYDWMYANNVDVNHLEDYALTMVWPPLSKDNLKDE